MSVAPAEVVRPETLEETERPWITIVWNDPVNLMSYVTYVFMEYFGYDRAKAERLMMDVHEKGRAVVSNGTPRGDGARRRPRCTGTGCGPPCRRTTDGRGRASCPSGERGVHAVAGGGRGRAAASLARQLQDFVATDVTTRTPTRSRPRRHRRRWRSRPTDPALRRLFPTPTSTTRRRRASSGATPSVACATRKAAQRPRSMRSSAPSRDGEVTVAADESRRGWGPSTTPGWRSAPGWGSARRARGARRAADADPRAGLLPGLRLADLPAGDPRPAHPALDLGSAHAPDRPGPRRRDGRPRPRRPSRRGVRRHRGPGGHDRPERFVPMVNAARSPTFYEFDSMDLLRLYRDMDARDEEPVVDLPLAHRHRGVPLAHRHLLRLGARGALRPRVDARERHRGRPSSCGRTASWTAS